MMELCKALGLVIGSRVRSESKVGDPLVWSSENFEINMTKKGDLKKQVVDLKSKDGVFGFVKRATRYI